MFIINKKYLIATAILFLVEVLIAVFIHDTIIRPYIGDLLVVVLLYCFVKSFVRVSVLNAAIGVLLFSYLIEFLQFLNIVERMGLSKIKLARIIIGTSFSWEDIAAYTVGFLIVLLCEKLLKKL
jgi:Protein of unknown function (DUF2809)